MRSLKRARVRLTVHSVAPRRISTANAPPTPCSTSGPPTSSVATPPAPKRKPITSVLIANRGEIALRIHRTAARLGIATTTLYTDIDARSQHALCSPLALALGPASAGGYLDGARIVALAQQHGIEALHPGYGFLSENAGFAARCEAAGITFVGPPARAMADMGDKARSKALMTAAGVPCVPGYHGAEQAAEQLLDRARQVGFPVLLKSVRGGGGKGMRIVGREADFEAQLGSARAEARASFGEGGEVMLVERYIVRPRHVEVQVFADGHGHCVALGERDCSVQRRHQKILEESPAPLLDEATRHDLWDKARTAALAVGYVGAGTVEFILDRDTGDFFFMEMNTRLQVEHPVSEMVTGTDLVEWQFRVAAGEPLPLTQDEIEQRIRARGHAVEARIYAENPARAFFPDSGTLVHLATPRTEDDSVRIDAGFVEGDTVSEAYDGLIAKLIVRGEDRATAIRKMEMALRDYEVVGLSTNIEFLKRLCRSPAFLAGDVETGFIDKWREELFRPQEVEDEVFVQAALGLLSLTTTTTTTTTATTSSWQQQTRDADARGEPLGFGDVSASAQGARRFAFRLDDDNNNNSSNNETVQVALTQMGPGLYNASVARSSSETTQEFDSIVCEPQSSSPTRAALTTFYPLARIDTTIVQDPTRAQALSVFQRGSKTQLTLLPPSWLDKALGRTDVAASVVAPMPCKILRNEVVEGQSVEKGAPLVV
jgi:3-methylcrotonyl-CoA carboxylase alpha subunit